MTTYVRLEILMLSICYRAIHSYMSHEHAHVLETASTVYIFEDPRGVIYRLLRRGAKISEVADGLMAVKRVHGNVLLTSGIYYVFRVLAGLQSLTPFNYLGVGDSTTAASASQTCLLGSNQAWQSADSGYPIVSNNTYEVRATFGPNAANFAWNEWGLANAPNCQGVTLNRVQTSLGTKQSGQTWALDVTISIS